MRSLDISPEVLHRVQSLARQKNVSIDRCLERLLDNEERFSNVLSIANVGVWELDFGTQAVIWSDEFMRICGLDPETTTPSLALGFSLIHPEDRPAAAAAVEESQTQGTRYHIEKRIVRPSGDVRWVLSRGECVFDEQKQPLKLVGTFLDITALKRAEEELRASSELYQVLVEGAQEGIWLLDENAETQYVNARMAEMLGYSPQEMIGRHFFQFMDAEAQAEARMNFQRRREGIAEQHDFRFQRKDGSSIWTVVSTNPLFDDRGRFWGALGMISDITARREVEQALRQSELRYRLLYEAITDALFVHTVDPEGFGRFIEVNSVACDYLGYTREELLNLSPSAIDAPDSDVDHELIRERLQNEQSVRFEQVHIAKSGERIPVEIHARFFMLNDTPAVISLVRDLRERRQVEQQLLALQMEKERAHILSDFVRNAAHEFRTPLSVINSCAFLMARSDDRERRAVQMQRIEHQVKNTARLVQLMLRRVKLDSGAPLERQPADLNEVVLSAVHEAPADEPSAPVTLDLASDLPPVALDTEQMSRAVAELLDNARHYTPLDGQIELRTYRDGSSIVVSCRDTGIGMSAEDLTHLFESFWRADEARSTTGFGLGLPIARKIVELHGGRMEVESAPGQGSVFRIVLPVEG